MITFKNVTKKYPNNSKDAIHNLNLKINSGDFYILVGQSGSGKTTTIKMINSLIKPTHGTIVIDGKKLNDIDIQKLRRHTGYVLQNGALFPNLTVTENIGIQLEMLKVKKSERNKRAKQLLKEVGLDPKIYANRFPSELSGGEQQRVGIARALAVKPNFILMDEPFSALDPLAKKQLQDVVLKLHKQNPKLTFVFVTHDMREALKLGDKIAVLKGGVLQQAATPKEVIAHPANQFVKDLFKNTANNNKISLINIIKSGLVPTINNSKDKNYPNIDINSSLAKVANKLQDHPKLITNFNNQSYLITTPLLLKFLAQKTENN